MPINRHNMNPHAPIPHFAVTLDPDPNPDILDHRYRHRCCNRCYSVWLVFDVPEILHRLEISVVYHAMLAACVSVFCSEIIFVRGNFLKSVL